MKVGEILIGYSRGQIKGMYKIVRIDESRDTYWIHKRFFEPQMFTNVEWWDYAAIGSDQFGTLEESINQPISVQLYEVLDPSKEAEISERLRMIEIAQKVSTCILPTEILREIVKYKNDNYI